MNYMKINALPALNHRMKSLQGKLHGCDGAWRRCNCLKEGNYSAQLRLALRHHNHTLYPAQLRILGYEQLERLRH